MDRDALKRALQDRFEQSVDEALAAVDQAPDGRWIAASEWEIRAIFQKLMGDCYRQMLQAKCDAAAGAAFSPGGQGQVQEQGNSGVERPDRRG